MKIYTKTGDKGETGTFGGGRVSKANLRIRLNGDVDELNASIGLLVSKLDYGKLKESLLRVQNELFEAGTDISALRKGENALVDKSYIERLEDEIDNWDKDLPVLKNFILPGGSEEASVAHWCRTICRRAERQAVSLHKIEKLNPFIIAYLNRLSDWFFTVARYLNKLSNHPEIKFNNKRNSDT